MKGIEATEKDEARRKRIEAIKAAIEKGTYEIDAKAVAKKLLAAHLTEALLRVAVEPPQAEEAEEEG
ncbi:MAG: flagellar biosynthesis anti-sigma factor FlgM [Deltaproteobacteria bacterium]|nr:MAG: flagellar biosynthesis anti-sigma factor FlgM [Deltaproteobacteria bacterium]